MKHTLISGLFIYPGKVGGAEIYFNNLLSGFVENGYTNQMSLLMNKEFIDQFDPLVQEFDTHYIEVKRNRVLYDSTLPMVHKSVKQHEVVFSPNYVTTLTHLTGKQAYTTTIHDLQYQHFPQFFSTKKRKWQYFAHTNTLKACKKVICISDFVKEDICKVYGEKYRDKLVVIHNAIDFCKLDKTAQSEQFSYDFPYILSVAAHYPHKNTLTLVKAFNEFNRIYPNTKLVLAGQLSKNLVGGDYEAYGAQLEAAFNANPNIITTGFVSDGELSQLYRNASFFVFPSLFEGFGMPPVEAMSIGKPVITTRCGSLEEVTLGKAFYMNEPQNEEELAHLMQDCFANLDEKTYEAESLVQEVRHHYSPKTVARSYIDLFESL